MDKINIYFAAPLFTEGEQMYNNYVVKQIREKFGDKVRVYLPQENEAINDKSGYADSLRIYDADANELKTTDILIALLDGPTPDVGVAGEVGYFANRVENEMDKDLNIIGLYTDIRQGGITEDKVKELYRDGESQWSYINLWVVGAVKSNGVLTTSVKVMLDVLERNIEQITKSEQ